MVHGKKRILEVFFFYLKVAVAAVSLELLSAAAAESAAFPVVGTKTEI